MCFLIHDWNKWESYEINSYSKGLDAKGEKRIVMIEKRQKRECKKCGKLQDKRISIIW